MTLVYVLSRDPDLSKRSLLGTFSEVSALEETELARISFPPSV